MTFFIQPEWPAPISVKSLTTRRAGGVSLAPFDSLNLATHVGDSEEKVLKNRNILREILQLPAEPYWLNQTHSTLCANIAHDNPDVDASFTTQKNTICAILTADCLPILLCNHSGTIVSAIHAGWRGLAHGIIENTIKSLPCEAKELMAWLGPAIGPQNFEVGHEVREIFLNSDTNTEKAFVPSINKRWLCDIYAIAKLKLKTLGVNAIYGGEYCTYTDSAHFYSYRRDGAKTGRMASLIWIE